MMDIHINGWYELKYKGKWHSAYCSTYWNHAGYYTFILITSDNKIVHDTIFNSETDENVRLMTNEPKNFDELKNLTENISKYMCYLPCRKGTVDEFIIKFKEWKLDFEKRNKISLKEHELSQLRA